MVDAEITVRRDTGRSTSKVDSENAVKNGGLAKLGRRMREFVYGEERLERIEALERLRLALVKEKLQFEGRREIVPVVNYSSEDIEATLEAIQAANSRLTEGGLPNVIYFCEGDISNKPVMAVKGKRSSSVEEALLATFSNVHFGAGLRILITTSDMPKIDIKITDAGMNSTYPAVHEITFKTACDAIRSFAKILPQAGIDRSRLIGHYETKDMKNISPKKA